MKILKQFIAISTLLFMLSTITYAEGDTLSFLATKEGDNITIVEQEHISVVDNSDLYVEVFQQVGDRIQIIYQGPLGGYDNGKWSDRDFSIIEFLVIIDCQSETNEIIYVVPATIQPGSQTQVTDDNEKQMNDNTGITDFREQTLTGNPIQYIEYDVTYNIIADGQLSMNINYTVLNESSSDDVVTLLAILYDNGRLSDMQTQSLSVDISDSNSDNMIFSLPDNCENCYVKLMVWEGMDTLRPIGTGKRIVDLDQYTREKYMYITASENVGFNVYMNATTVKGNNDAAIHTLQYDPLKISPIDLCGFTYTKELTTGEIENTNIVVRNADLSGGKIAYEFQLESGRNTGIINMVKFKALSNVVDESIIYTIQ